MDKTPITKQFLADKVHLASNPPRSNYVLVIAASLIRMTFEFKDAVTFEIGKF